MSSKSIGKRVAAQTLQPSYKKKNGYTKGKDKNKYVGIKEGPGISETINEHDDTSDEAEIIMEQPLDLIDSLSMASIHKASISVFFTFAACPPFLKVFMRALEQPTRPTAFKEHSANMSKQCILVESLPQSFVNGCVVSTG
ncbi:hypothetical protein BGZ83_005119 [Gryganskiella cystojenkinii]|nr:hypothetical protein BGZ83_005119 [Gryganskiella cystojenkinii]